jgi:hypothetical protein
VPAADDGGYRAGGLGEAKAARLLLNLALNHYFVD